MPQSPIADPLTWRAVTAPSLVDFEILANDVYRGLPKKFRSLCADLVIRIEDFATDEILDDMDLDNPFDLLGLFQGVGPNMIWLYRRPILDYWSNHEEALGDVVAHVLVHEIGHHFGLSDDDMEAIEVDAG
jgi:predicted Zn-dependent protease with MMP-like domain